MTENIPTLRNFVRLSLVFAAIVSMPVSAFQFYMGDVEAGLNTNLSLGASWRVEDRDKRLIGVGNLGPLGNNPFLSDPYTGGASLNNDDGNLNFGKGDTYSKLIKGNTDFIAQYEDYGVFARAKYWYDFQLKDGEMATDPTGKRHTLSPEGDANASGGEILDAYFWVDHWFGEMPFNLRVGKQVVSWGESTFIFNGINVINPVDIGAIRAPGAQLKDALLPVNMVYGSLGVTEEITVEAFVQLEFESTEIDDCGTFLSTVDYVAEGCGPVLAAGALPEDDVSAQGAIVPREADIEADDTDQFGIALRWFLPDWNETELGLYFIQYHNRYPTVSGTVADLNVGGAFDPGTGATYLIEYAEKIQLLGLSFNTSGPGGISLGGEYSFKHDMPVQANTFDLLLGAIGNENSALYQDRIEDSNGDNVIDSADAGSFYGSFQHGYDRFDVSQLQVTAIKFINQIWGASSMTFVGEVGATYVHDLPDLSEMRYGRYAQLGYGLTQDYNLPGDPLTRCQAINLNFNGCTSEGFVTSFSWGFRTRTSLLYSNVFSGVNLIPTLAWSSDMVGNAPGPGANFIEGRRSVGVSLKADYLTQYSANIAYTRYFGAGDLNALTDKDNVSLSLLYSF